MFRSNWNLGSAYLGRYRRNCMSFTELKTYSLKLKIYCKLDILMKTVNWKLHTIANELFNCNNFNIHSWSWNYCGCWHQMYPQINRSTWLKCWPNVTLTWCSTALGHYMPLPGAVGGRGYIWPNISLTHRLTKCHADLQLYHSLTTRCLHWGWVWDVIVRGANRQCRGHQGALGG